MTHNYGILFDFEALAEARKRHLYLVLAHKQLSQFDERMREALGNVGTLVCFGLDLSDAEL